MSRAVDVPPPAVMEDRAAQKPSVARTIAGLRTYRTLLRNLVVKDLKLKYRGSVIGFAWSLANPLLMVAVYTLAFQKILMVRSEGFVFYLLIGLLSWTYFANAMMMATGAIVDSGGLVKSVWFPRAILPTATVLFNLAQYLLTVLVFLPVMLAWHRIPPGPTMLLFPVIVLLQTAFSIGLALILATGTTFFRDVRHLVEVAITVLFWMTPILYTLEDMGGKLRALIALSPMSPYIMAYHDILYYKRWPTPEVWALCVLYAAVALTVGLRVMVRHEDEFAERI